MVQKFPRFSHIPLFRWSFNIAAVLALSYTFTDNVVYVNSVRGPSMAPALSPNFHETGKKDEVLVWKWAATRNLRRGQVIIFWQPHDPRNASVKRIIGLPGDTVFPNKSWPMESMQVPNGHVWVEGDNWGNSVDSNQFGPLPQNLIVGKAVCVLHPLTRWGSIPEPSMKRKIIQGLA